MKHISLSVIQLEIITPYIGIMGIVGIIGIIINLVRLFTNANQSFTLKPQANLRQLPKDDQFYELFLCLESQPIDQVYQTCLNQYQELLVRQYLPKIFLYIGLTIIPIIYLLSEWLIINDWEDSLFIVMGMVILPISWIIAFTIRVYSIIFCGLLSAWFIYAVSLSGHILFHDTLLLFLFLIYFITGD